MNNVVALFISTIWLLSLGHTNGGFVCFVAWVMYCWVGAIRWWLKH